MIDILLMQGLLIHFFADFALQTHEQAVNKSSSIKWLFYHAGVYSLCWLLFCIPILGFYKALIFAVITFIAHSLTDYITSRIGKPFWQKQDLHNGFVVVGLDQVLHYIQLYYTFKLLIQ